MANTLLEHSVMQNAMATSRLECKVEDASRKIDFLEKQYDAMMEMMLKLTAPSAPAPAPVEDDAKSTASREEDDPMQLKRVFNNLMTKLYTTSEHAATFDLLKTLYDVKPELFQIQGTGLHNDQKGTMTYFSVHVCKNPGRYDTMHISGAWRFDKFKVREVTYRNKGRAAGEYTWDFQRE
jgi:hypothetical protein